MITLNTILHNKMERWEYDRCQVDKTIELPHSEFEHFRRNTLADYDFISNSLDDLPTTNDNTRHCIMVLDEEADDGILVDPQGYDYARYSAYVPNARQLCRLGQYSSLEDMNREMGELVEHYTKEVLQIQSEGQVTLSLSDVGDYYQSEYQGFLDHELFKNMLMERPEFDDIEENCGDLFITVNPQYERVYTREISPRELEVICAKHTLWLNDAGGEQADLSNCVLKGLSLYGKDLSNSRCEFAVFEDCNMQSVDFSNAEMESVRFDGCFMQDIFANKTNFVQANFTNCDISNSVITDSLLTSAAMNHCKVENSQITKCQTEGFKYPETDMDKAACYTSQTPNETSDMKLS